MQSPFFSRAAPRPQARPRSARRRRRLPASPSGRGRGRPPTGKLAGSWPTPTSKAHRLARRASDSVSALRPSPPTYRCRRPQPPWAPRQPADHSGLQHRRRPQGAGFSGPDVGPSRLRPDPTPEGLRRGPVARMAWAMTRKVGPPCELRAVLDPRKGRGCDSRMAGIFWDLSIYKFCAHSTIKPPLCVSLGSGCHFLRAIACGDRVWQSRRRRTGRT